MNRLKVLILFLLALALMREPMNEPQGGVADPLQGTWVLEGDRSQYGISARRRQEETFECSAAAAGGECVIRSLFEDGRRVEGRFRLSYDGTAHVVSGLPDVDQVRLTRVSDVVVDATFVYRGRPAFAYRAMLSENRQYLTVIAVDPASRAVLHSVVTYRRR